MKVKLESIIQFFQAETVFCVATFAAVVSAFFVPPSKEYISYIDFRVLALLFCLMLVVAGFQSIGVFDRLLPFLMKYVHTVRQLVFVLVLSCFFLSMWITNDVALITLVPFTIMVLNKLEKNELLVLVVVMQTIAANLGSMATPIGNPQNLYLYTVSGMTVADFFCVMLPYTIFSLVLVVVGCLFFRRDSVEYYVTASNKNFVHNRAKQKGICYIILLFCCLLTVFHLLDYRISFAMVVVVIFFVQRQLLLRVDYMLLLTFVAFFVFVGNCKNIPVVNELLMQTTANNEVILSIASSQFISNVPAAVLLSGFTDNKAALMIGTNIGGLGTLIASMASLISFKYYGYTKDCRKGYYLLCFTGINVIYLIGMFLFYLLI